MKRLIHTPGLLLIAGCGLVCSLLAWDAAEEWLYVQYVELWNHAIK